MYLIDRHQKPPSTRLLKSADSMDPHALTEGTRISICQSPLLRSLRKEFLEDPVTINKSCVLHDSNAHCVFWIPREGQQARSNMYLSKQGPTCTSGRLFYCWFRNSKGMLYSFPNSSVRAPVCILAKVSAFCRGSSRLCAFPAPFHCCNRCHYKPSEAYSLDAAASR